MRELRTIGVFGVWVSALALPAMSQTQESDQTGSQPEQADRLAAEESLARFDELLRRRPFHDSAFDALVSHFTKDGRLDDLIASYEARVEALPDETSLRVVLARLLARAGDAKRASEVLASLDTETFGRDEVDLLVLRAEIEGVRGELDHGRALLEEAIAKATTIAEQLDLAEALADLHLRAGNQDEAADALLGAMERIPDEYLHHKRIADALVQRQLDRAAIGAFSAILEGVGNRSDRRVEVLRQLGMAHERLGEVEPALQAYAEAIDLLGEGHWLQRELSERIVSLYRAGGRLAELETYCRQRIERSPSQVSSRLLLAEVQEARGNTEEARATLDRAVELFPADTSLSERLIALLERTGEIPDALDEFERIIAEHPDDPEQYIAYGQFLIRHEQVEAARRQWQHVLESEVSDASLVMRLALLFEPREMYDDAVTCYERAIELAPDQPGAYSALARLWLLRGEPERAREALDRLAEANPGDASIQAERSRGLQLLGDLDAALEALVRASELDPTQVRYLEDRAILLTRMGRTDEALAIRRDALDKMTNPVTQAQAIAALVSTTAGVDGLDALEQTERARLDAEPDSPLSMLILATIADHRRDLVASRTWLERLLAAHPDHEEARRQIARLHEATGDLDAAIQSYTTLIEQHPGRARQYYQSIVDAQLRHNDRAAAVRTLDRLVTSNPDNVTVLDAVGEQLARLDEIDRAVEVYRQALRQQPDRYESLLAYANVLIQNGQLNESLEHLRHAALQTVDRETAAQALARLRETAGRLGQLQELLDDLERQVEADPSRTLMAGLATQLLIEEYEYDRAVGLLDLVLRANPRDVNMHISRAALLRRLARFDEAIDTYQRVLRFPQVDRDYVLGELGAAAFEAGRIEQAARVWRQIDNKQYAGSLLKNHSLLDDAIEVLREGIRFKPDDTQLHRALISTLEEAGRESDALAASRTLVDLEPDNADHVRDLAMKYLRAGDRAGAAQIAGRLFSASVTQPPPQNTGTAGWQSYLSMYSSYGVMYSMNGGGTLDQAVLFFVENGLLAELKTVLVEQLDAQPDNALLHDRAVSLYAEELGEPKRALELLSRLETMEFPLEHQTWLGSSSQRDSMRARAYQLIAMRPGLRDDRLAVLQAKGVLNRDEKLELAIVRQGQGDTEAAVELLTEVVEENPDDLLASSALTDLLMALERHKAALPVISNLAERLDAQREEMLTQTIERVRRDYVRTLPLPLQVRIDDGVLREIAQKFLQGGLFSNPWSGEEAAGVMNAYRARLAQAQVYAELDEIEKAREIWRRLAPTAGADADGWVTLASVVQEYEQDDLAFEFYSNALEARRVMNGDPLLERIYGGSQMQYWYYEDEGIDTAFNRLLRSFADHGSLIELYDFLREQGQAGRARQIARQYDIDAQLAETYRARVADARARFLASADDPITASVPYFAEVCKLAEVLDRRGDWEDAESVYTAYLQDFPDETGLLTTLSQIAEAQADLDSAIEWQMATIEATRRLAGRSRVWSLRELSFAPAIPSVIASTVDSWDWQDRWGLNRRWGYSNQNDDLTDSWLRIARLHLANKNHIAAGDAMTRAMREARGNRSRTARSVLALIRQRQLTDELLPVLRTLAVAQPDTEEIQIAFAESLEANDKADVAVEVYRRILRRGVSDLAALTTVRSRLAALVPEDASVQGETLESLEEAVADNPNDVSEKLRLAKAYYYSLRPLDALMVLDEVRDVVSHVEEAVDLRIEIYTLLDRRDELISALREQVAKAGIERRQSARRQLVRELLLAGRSDEAIEELKQLADPSEPDSYLRIGLLLQYFGRHDEAIEQFQLGGNSQQGGQMMAWQGDQSGPSIARAMAIRGDTDAVVDKIFEVVDRAAQQTMMMQGMSMFFGDEEESQIEPFVSLFVLEPDIADLFEQRLVQKHEATPDDLATTKLLIDFYRRSGRGGLAQELLDTLAGQGTGDQKLVEVLINRAIAAKDFDRAIELAGTFIERQPKPVIPAGTPAEYAAMMSLMSPRNAMICKLGDVYWTMGNADKAFEIYLRLIDEKVEATRLAYATICLVRDRTDEAREIVDEQLKGQEVRSPQLLTFRALIAGLDGDERLMFDLIAEADSLEVSDNSGIMFGGSSDFEQQLRAIARTAGLEDVYFDHLRGKVERAPGEFRPRQTLATQLREAGRMEEGLAVLEEAAAIAPMRLQALELKYEWLSPSMSPEDKVTALREQLALSEQQTGSIRQQGYRYSGGSIGGGTRGSLGDLLWDLGRQDEAITVWTERQDDSSENTHLSLGARMAEREAWDRAEAAYRRALDLSPTSTQAHLALVRICIRKNNTSDALAHMVEIFREAISPHAIAGGWNSNSSTPYHALTAVLRESPDLETAIAGLDPERAADARLMMAIWTGRWDETDRIVESRLADDTYNPTLWLLRARCREELGDIEGSLGALHDVARLAQTTLPQRHEQLQLALAGKQVQEAIGGQSSSGMSSMSYPGMSYSSYYGYGRADNQTMRLATLCTCLGDFEKAERLLLAQTTNASSLPTISGLMWRRGDRDRAMELLRLYLLSDTGSTGRIPEYVVMLAETGRLDEAVEMAIRQYRYASADTDPDTMFYAYYRYYREFDTEALQLENDMQERISETLSNSLQRTNTLNETLDALITRVEAAPDDRVLFRLTVSLLLHNARADQALLLLRDHLDPSYPDPSLATALYTLSVQQRDTESALAALEYLRDVVPERDLERRRALANLAGGHAQTAREQLAARLTGSDSDDIRTDLLLLIASGGLQETLSLLEGSTENLDLAAALDPTPVTCAALCDAAINALWNSPEPFGETSVAISSLESLMRVAHAEGVPLSVADEVDNAVLTIISGDPDNAVTELRNLRTARPDDIRVLRALHYGAHATGNTSLEAEVLTLLVDLLRVHHNEPWTSQTPPRSSETVRAALAEMVEADLDTEAILGASAGYGGSIIDQAMGSLSNTAAVRFQEELLEPYVSELRNALARLGDADRFDAAMKIEIDGNNRQYDWQMYQRLQSYGYEPYEYGWREYGANSSRERILLDAGRYELYLAEDTAPDRLLDSEHWLETSLAFAATGQADESRRFRDRAGSAAWSTLRDQERPFADSNRYAWSSAAYLNERELRTVSMELDRVQVDRDDRGSNITGPADEPWEIAFLGSDLTNQLAETAETLGAGWGGTRTLHETLSFLWAQERYGDVLALLDRVYDERELLSSSHASWYLIAASLIDDHARFERALELATVYGAPVQDELHLLRLCHNRRIGNVAKADSLESTLLAACVAPPADRLIGDPALRSRLEQLNVPVNAQVRSRNNSQPAPAQSAFAFSSLASTVGINLSLSDDIMTLERIEQAYAGFGLFEDAIRIAQMRLATIPDKAGAADIERRICAWLHRLDRHDEALAHAERVIEQMLRFPSPDSKDAVVDFVGHARGGNDPERALALLRDFKAEDPFLDRAGLTEASLLSACERHTEAWELYRGRLHTGDIQYDDADMLYDIGLAAHAAKEEDTAHRLLRAALWQDPEHKLAEHAREVLDD